MSRRETMNYELYDPYVFHWTVKKGISVALIAVAATFGLVKAGQHSDAEAAKYRQEISAQLRQDGFPAHDKGLSNGYFEDLILGACDFHYVSADIVEDDGHIDDIKNYSAPVGDGNVEISFENARQLQQALPSVDCFPGK